MEKQGACDSCWLCLVRLAIGWLEHGGLNPEAASSCLFRGQGSPRTAFIECGFMPSVKGMSLCTVMLLTTDRLAASPLKLRK